MGNVVNHMHGFHGCPRLMFDDVQYLLCLIHHCLDWFLDELTDLLQENHFISIHFTTILQELARAGYSVKKLKRIATERSEEKRAAFVYRIAEYTQEQLGFLDKTSKDEKTPGCCSGRVKRGRRAK